MVIAKHPQRMSRPEMFSEGDAFDVKNVALEPLFVIPDRPAAVSRGCLSNSHIRPNAVVAAAQIDA